MPTARQTSSPASGPAGKKVTVEVSDYGNSLFGGDPYDETRKLNVSGGGSYSHDFSTDGIDLLGGAEVMVDYSAQGGLVHVIRRMTVPYLYIQIGDSHFGGAARPNKHVGLTLTLGGNEVATGDAVADFVSSGFDGLFVDADGDTYKIVGGEHVASTGIAGDASFTIPAINAQVALASDKISGTCFANQLVGCRGDRAGLLRLRHQVQDRRRERLVQHRHDQPGQRSSVARGLRGVLQVRRRRRRAGLLVA